LPTIKPDPFAMETRLRRISDCCETLELIRFSNRNTLGDQLTLLANQIGELDQLSELHRLLYDDRTGEE